MLNWDDLKHIHVIRKFDALLSSWYKVDLLFLDEHGEIRNLSQDSNQKFESSLFQAIYSKPEGIETMKRFFKEASERVFQSGRNQLVMDGPLGVDKIMVSRIALDQQYLGCVLVYPFTDVQVTGERLQKAKGILKSIGFDADSMEKVLSEMNVITGKEERHFYEIVDLVAQEIVTYHTEILKREEKINNLSNQLGERYSYDSMIGKSKPMQNLYSMLDKIRASESTVLVQGENGTGKELIARAIHYNSSRKSHQFVTVNCSAFNENLLDSELFGHVKGAFTGAVKDKKGLFEAANGGTLFLDEIGDMSPTMQVKLLRVLQEGTLTPVGGTELRRVDVRVVAATNRNLKEMIEKGEFREDLYYRINVINLHVPSLRDRKEDIPLLIEFFLKRGCDEKELPLKLITKRTMEKLFDYAWPGNIRELENEIERLIVLAGSEEKIMPDLLSPRIRDFGEGAKQQGVRLSGKLKDALEELEKNMIREGLKRTGWNKSRLAKELGISRAGLIMKVDKYDLDKRKIMQKQRQEQESGGDSDEGAA